MTVTQNTTVFGSQMLGSTRPITCAVLLTGILANTAFAASEITPAQQSLDTPQPAKPLGVGKINYLKIPGYAGGSTVYAKNAKAQNNSIGELNIIGIATVGYTLAAAPILKEMHDGNTQFEDSNPNDSLPDGITYQWYRTCSSNSQQPEQFAPLVEASLSDYPRPVDTNTNWCSITDENESSTQYTLTGADVGQQVTVVIRYQATWGPETFSSTKNIRDICPIYPNFDNDPPYECNIIFETSFE
ncbi:MAG: hypothetical protein CSA45_01445 [Gammaproteobacteria bacterium]|nr:MAG: hypothetical protein CSA45_01445 [Gammaproteobacteria bacterium]